MLPGLPHNSRYQGIETSSMTVGGREIVYFQRRFLPAPEQMAQVQQHRVVQSDRLDTLSVRYFADPELFWRICDANRAMHPAALTEIAGRRLRITLPVGIAAAANA